MPKISTYPLVSVILPAYNAAAFLARTLVSVLGQTYDRLELIVVDDGSQDETAEIVQALAQSDRRIKFLQQANAGVAAARNAGIAVAQGELIAPIDADDLWYPKYLEKLVHCLTQAPVQVGVVYAWSEDIDADDRPTGGLHVARIRGNVYRTLLCHNFLGNASATLIRRNCLRSVGGYDGNLLAQQAQGCEDWDLYLRLAARYEFRVVPEFLVGYRKLADSMSGDGQTMARSQALMLARVQCQSPEIPAWYYGLARSSFCLYLAHQAAQKSIDPTQLDLARHWLSQAKRAHYWATVLRPDRYMLLLMLSRKQSERLQFTHLQSTKRESSARSYKSFYGLTKLKVWLKVWVTQGLHLLLSGG